MRKTVIFSMLMSFIALHTFAQTKPVDEIVFGNPSSEKRHSLSQISSQIIKGGLNEPARQLLPVEGERVEGGNMTFKMKVNPDMQNYFTVRFWGSDTGNSNILILFCEGKQIGYRHLGDYDMLDIANEDAPYQGRFTYTTLPLPLSMTKGKKEIELSIRSTGSIFRYGETFDSYQKPMVKPSKALYKGYTHTGTCFIPSKSEKQGKEPQATVRTAPGEEVLTEVKNLVNTEINKILARKNNSEDELLLIAEAYYVPWTTAYKKDVVIQKVISETDRFYNQFKEKPSFIETWSTAGKTCNAIYFFVPQIREVLDAKMENGRTRRQNWSELLTSCVEYAKTHRRQYTNQSMIVDLYLYHVNRILAVVEYEKALPVYQPLRYLYESMGLAPWLGRETNEGPEKPLGTNYFQLTEKGLTKELGFVGGYGEILHWMNLIYDVTGEKCLGDSRDAIIREQILKMAKARSYFRYPSLDNDGYRAMRAEAVIGWRDHGYYPANILYGEKGYTRETEPFMVTASTMNPNMIAHAQQMLDDNQFFSVVKERMTDRGTQSIYNLLRVPQNYELIKNQPHRNAKLPMSKGMPDVVFSDEEIGVVAIKNGEEIFYASLYWRSNYAVNFLARIHYMTPETDHVATVFEDVKFTDSGLKYKRPGRVNLHFSDARDFYPGVQSAHTGEELPIAKVPDGISWKPGQENIYAGRGDFYTLRYGNYLIGMNCTRDRNFTLEIPKAKGVVELPSKSTVKVPSLSVAPMSTVVLYIPE